MRTERVVSGGYEAEDGVDYQAAAGGAGHDAVTADSVIEYLNKNVRNAQLIMRDAVRRLGQQGRQCKCATALKNAIFTAPDLWPEQTRKKLDAIVRKYARS